MNLYLIERTDDWGYDEYDSYVFHGPSPDWVLCALGWEDTFSSSPKITLIGTATDGLALGAVLGSFNAG